MTRLILLTGFEYVSMITMILNIHTQNVEGLHHVVANLGGTFFFFDFANQGVSLIPATGIQFYQGIPAVVQQRFQASSFLCTGRQQGLQHGLIAFQCFLPVSADMLVHSNTHSAAFGKGIEALLEPAILDLLTGTLQIGTMNPYRLGLADTIQTTDPLLQQV